ncbi:tetratricopeptide repeat protein [Desulfobacter latus]|uniref:Tetratricopeptide repeat protein n=1 Tax=Desulfobacter latus TaxID=2292 RepID=A0A850T7R6_9BACT|nr:tetratricopeptide repeat protein [Desulfobacter latus]NWH04458.1 tetratricopeptide repeat protein [Desulfobacter latus]
MTNEKSVALTELVASLGYYDAPRLSNWVRGIIKDKEDFKKFIAESEKDNFNKRQEKFLVKSEAETFVDNLCILNPYKRLFPKSTEDGNAFPPYRMLKGGVDSKKISLRGQKLQTRLKIEKKLSEEALRRLPPFYIMLKNYSSIDIESDSLRDLLAVTMQDGAFVDFSESFKISAWNELTELKGKLAEEGESADIYRRIGEKFMELGDADATIEVLDNATNMDQTDGASWALKAKLYFELLKASKKDLVNAAARSETLGPIGHPITSEEHWINERIVDTSSTVEDTHNLFIQSCFAALEHWPRGSHWKKGKDDEHRRYKPYAIDSGYSSVDVHRDWLFFHFVLALKKRDFCKNSNEYFMNILRSFQGFDPENYPIPNLILGISVESENKIVFDVKLVEILSWISMETAEVALERMIEEFRSWKFGAAKHIAILGSSNISKLFWNYLGRDEYIKLYSLCNQFDQQNRQMECVATLCRMQLETIFSSFDPIISMHGKLNLPELYWQQEEKSERPSEERFFLDFKGVVSESVHLSTGWHSFLNDEVWVEKPYSSLLPKELLALILVSPLLELVNGQLSDIGRDVLYGFADNQGGLGIAVKVFQSPFSETRYKLFDLLIQCVKNSSVLVDDKKIVGLCEGVQDVVDEIEYEFLDF